MEGIEAMENQLKETVNALQEHHEYMKDVFHKYREDTTNFLGSKLETLYAGINYCINDKSARVQEIVNGILQRLEVARDTHNTLFRIRGELVEVINVVACPTFTADDGDNILRSGQGEADLNHISRETEECVESLNHIHEKYVELVNEIVEKISSEVAARLACMEREMMEKNLEQSRKAEAKSEQIQEELNKARLILQHMGIVKDQIEKTFFLGQ